MSGRPRPMLWLRWSWRDLRARWGLVLALALVIALAAGMSAGLGSIRTWRDDSLDRSFALLRMHDLRVTLTEGSVVDAGSLDRLARSIADRDMIAAVQERLIVPTQIDASRPGRTILVPGRLVGAPIGGPSIDATVADGGRVLSPADAGLPVGVLEARFAAQYDLPPRGELLIPGGRTLRYVGRGRQPEYFIVTTPNSQFGAEANFAVVFTSLETAQALGGRPGKVSEAVLRLAPGADAARVASQLEGAVAARLPGLGATITRGADEDAPRILYADAENDQRFIDVFAWLLLAGAALAAFNLVSRVVEAQRREIGIGMALGVPPRSLAIRPLLFGTEVALSGVLLGIGVGLGVAALLRPLLAELQPLPVLDTGFQPAIFARGALLGFLIPLLATIYPVWRGVSVRPIEAIRVGARAAAGSGLARLARRIPLPGGSLGQMPVRNVLRTPRRAAMSVLGIGAVITVVVALGGVFDSFDDALARARSETVVGTPDRMTATLGGFLAADSPALASAARSPTVARLDPALTLPGAVSSPGHTVEVRLELLEADGTVWRPRIAAGRFPSGAGVVLSREAARELGVGVGDQVALSHPVRTGPSAFRVTSTLVGVAGLHAIPFRYVAYMNLGQAGRMGLAGAVNTLEIAPGPGVRQADVQRSLFGRPAIASVQPAAANIDASAERMDEFLSILRFAQVVVLAIALLIAFNTTTISGEERAREHATMLAFGVRPRRVLGMAIGESALIGALATGVGILGGLAVLSWVVERLVVEVFPELGVDVVIGPDSIVSAVLVGVVAVALAPVLGARRLRRMDIPSTLRVVE